MAQYSTRTYSWQDLADDSVTWADWLEWTGNGTTIDGSTGYDNLVANSDVIDLGSSKTIVPLATVRSNGTSVSIAVQTSPDGSTSWATQTLGAITGRYFRFQITVVNASETARLDQIDAALVGDPISETLNAVSIGSTETALSPTFNYSKILGISYDAPKDVQVVLTDNTASAPAVSAYDLDTWGKVLTSTTANITIFGLQSVTTDSNGNIVTS